MKVRKDVEILIKDGVFYVAQDDGSLVDYGPAIEGEPMTGWFIEVDAPGVTSNQSAMKRIDQGETR